jgi:purine-nucleoside phosphorylase
MSLLTDLDDAVEFLRAEAGPAPRLAIVLGSGLGAFAETLLTPVVLPYAGIPHWPAAAVVGHAGRLVIGEHRAGPRVAVLSGRVHLYEGHPMARVVFGVRAMARWGVPTLVLTNAAGGIRPSLCAGSLMVIEDHINLMGANPLVGPNDDRLGERFPDMSDVYSAALRSEVLAAADAEGLAVQTGTYVGVLGPSYETPAEIRAFRALGADAVGMSTVPEAIAARHMGMAVAGISCITNAAAGVLPSPLRHDEVMETAARVRDQFVALLDACIARVEEPVA